MILGATIVLLIFLHFSGISRSVESKILYFLNPVLSRVYSFSSRLRITYNEQTKKSDLLGKIKKLEDENNSLIMENSRLKSTEDENKILREYLLFKQKSNLSFVLANIISRQNINFENSGGNIIINKGERDDLKIGMAVIGGEGVIIGKVINIKDDDAEVCLITGSDCKLAATMQNKDKTVGLVSGEFGLTVKMEFIPQTEEINNGDIVITSGLEENIPRGLVIGRVSEVKKKNNELWQSAIIEPLVDADNLAIVSVILP